MLFFFTGTNSSSKDSAKMYIVSNSCAALTCHLLWLIFTYAARNNRWKKNGPNTQHCYNHLFIMFRTDSCACTYASEQKSTRFAISPALSNTCSPMQCRQTPYPELAFQRDMLEIKLFIAESHRQRLPQRRGCWHFVSHSLRRFFHFLSWWRWSQSQNAQRT